MADGESVLIHGALGGFSAAFPGIAKQLGAGRVVGTVRSSKLHAATTNSRARSSLQAVAARLGQTEVDVLPFHEATTAHQRMASRSLNGRIVLTPDRSPP